MKVRKVWSDNNNELGLRPGSITVVLSNGMSVQLSAANGWSATVTGLPKYGKMTVESTECAGEWKYRVKEAQVSGYNAPVYLTSNHENTNNQYADDNGIIQNNMITVALPATGGMGTGVVYGAGAALLLLAVLGLILLNRKRTDGEGIR